MNFLFGFCVFIFLLLCVLLSSVILVQESRSMGLGSAFGGDSGNSLFGTGTADVLKKMTAWLAFIFMATCVFLSLWTSAVSVPPTPAPIEMTD